MNGLRFNDGSGIAYEFIADTILELDSVNPGAAAGLTRAFMKTGKLDSGRKALATYALQKLLRLKSLSNDVYEIAERCLES